MCFEKDEGRRTELDTERHEKRRWEGRKEGWERKEGRKKRWGNEERKEGRGNEGGRREG